MGVGQAIFYGSLVICATVALVLVGALRANRRAEPAERVWHVWNPTGRLTLVGVPWPDHDEDYEDCGCQSCYSVEIGLMEDDDEVLSLFLGLVDTPECHELANRARRYIR